MKKGEIWLVNFDPAIGTEYKKVRPALVIQSDKMISPLVTVVPLSSQLKSHEKNDMLVAKNSQNRLFSDSLLKVQQISSFDKERFFHFIGIMSQKSLLPFEKYLKKHFDL